MAQVHVQDRIQWGMNVAARSTGAEADAYRPSATSDPLLPCNRFLRLHALFSGMRGRFERPVPNGEALCHGNF
ncbi:MAG: hypothetical protein ACREDR_47780, partial [Blastocatellia bacterium]